MFHSSTTVNKRYLDFKAVVDRNSENRRTFPEGPVINSSCGTTIRSGKREGYGDTIAETHHVRHSLPARMTGGERNTYLMKQNQKEKKQKKWNEVK